MLRRRNPVLPVLLAALAASACGSKDAAEETADALQSRASSELLTYVPADTPFFFGSLEPFDDDVIEAMKPMTESVFQSYGSLIDGLLEDSDEDDGAWRPLLEILSEEFSDDKEYIFGLGYDSRLVVYTLGVLPVFRATLEDGAHFDQLIARLEADDEVELLAASSNGLDYRYIEAEQFNTVFARVDDQLVVSVVPTGASDAMLAAVTGAEKPANNLGDTDRLATLSADHGYLASYIGFLDTERLLDAIIGENDGVAGEMQALWSEDREPLSAVCQAEIKGLTEVVPEINFGYTEASTEQFRAKGVFELRDDIAAGIRTLSAPVPGVGGDMGGVAFFSFGIDLGAAKNFVGERVEAITAEPYQCEHLAGLNDAAAEAQQGMSTPLPPIVNNFKGLGVVVDAIRDFDIEGGKPPSLDMRAILAFDDIPSLLMMGQMMLPPLQGLPLEPNGEVFQVPQEMVMGAGITDPVFAAIAEDAMSFGVGAASKDRLAAMLTAPASDTPPLQTIGYDFSAYAKFMGDMAEKTGDPAGTEAVAIMRSMQDVMDRTWFSIEPGAHGLEIDTVLTLKQ